MKSESNLKTRPTWNRILSLVALTVVVMVTGYSHGQSGSHNGKLEGSIVDSSGALIAHAEVNLLNENTGDAKAKTADGEGHFIFPALEPGTYQVTISGSGFAESIFAHVLVNVGTTAT
jgi:hypothetical protein